MPEAINGKQTAVLFIRTRSIPYNQQQDERSIELQRQQCQRIAEELEATVIGDYTVVGGTREPVTQDTITAMLEELAHHPVDYVITTSLDRLTRNTDEETSLLAAIGAAGARLIVDGEPVTSELAARLTFPASERSSL